MTSPDRSGVARFTAFAGVSTFLLVFAGLCVAPLWDAPGSTAQAREIDSYLREHRAQTLASLLVYSAAMGTFLAFAAGVRSWLEDRGKRLAARVFAYGAASATSLVLAGFAPLAVLAYRRHDLAVVSPFYDLSFGLLALSGVPTALCMLAFAEIVRRDDVLPRWTGRLAVAGGLAHVAILGSFCRTSGVVSLEGEVIVLVPFTLFLWVLGTSIALLRQERGSKPRLLPSR